MSKVFNNFHKSIYLVLKTNLLILIFGLSNAHSTEFQKMTSKDKETFFSQYETKPEFNFKNFKEENNFKDNCNNYSAFNGYVTAVIFELFKDSKKPLAENTKDFLNKLKTQELNKIEELKFDNLKNALNVLSENVFDQKKCNTNSNNDDSENKKFKDCLELLSKNYFVQGQIDSLVSLYKVRQKLQKKLNQFEVSSPTTRVADLKNTKQLNSQKSNTLDNQKILLRKTLEILNSVILAKENNLNDIRFVENSAVHQKFISDKICLK